MTGEEAISILLGEMLETDREFVRSFRATSKKEKYYKLFEQLHQSLDLSASLSDIWVVYMSKPRVLVQGKKQIDLRRDTSRFKHALFNWLKTYPNDFEDVDLDLTKPESNKPVIPGISRKQISQMIKHKDRLSSEQMSAVKSAIKVAQNVQTDDPLFEKLREAFDE